MHYMNANNALDLWALSFYYGPKLIVTEFREVAERRAFKVSPLTPSLRFIQRFFQEPTLGSFFLPVAFHPRREASGYH